MEGHRDRGSMGGVRRRRPRHPAGRRAVRTGVVLALAASAVAASWCPVAAQVELRFVPHDTTLAVGDTISLVIRLDEALDVRSFEVRVRFDPVRLASLGGRPGQDLIDLGCFLYEGFELEAQDTWYGYAVVMDAACWLTGPGDLYVWEAVGEAGGLVLLEALDVALYAPQTGEIAGVGLPTASVQVIAPAGIDDRPPPPGRLQAHPNPFNPRVTIAWDLPRSQAAEIAVLAPDGRRVAVLATGRLPGGPGQVTWDGRTDAGASLPAGLYLVQLRTEDGLHVRKVTLVR
ncbi:MAG: FlgD immunoglobulin-like domain containing protein [Candidatus Krumholzibacteriia bacterium]